MKPRGVAKMSLPANGHTRKCPYCDNMAQFNFVDNKGHMFATQYAARIQPQDNSSSMQVIQIGVYKCCVCGCPVFIRRYGDGLAKEDLYPINIPSSSSSIPAEVREIYLEAMRCFSVKAWNATATMCRRAVQECIVGKGGEGKTLFEQIDNLYEKRVIQDDLKEWAHAIRILGKDGAHADVASNVGEEEAKFALEFTEALLNYVYVLKAKLASRRQKK